MPGVVLEAHRDRRERLFFVDNSDWRCDAVKLIAGDQPYCRANRRRSITVAVG
jgi:hypothetical protein